MADTICRYPRCAVNWLQSTSTEFNNFTIIIMPPPVGKGELSVAFENLYLPHNNDSSSYKINTKLYNKNILKNKLN